MTRSDQQLCLFVLAGALLSLLLWPRFSDAQTELTSGKETAKTQTSAMLRDIIRAS